MLQNFRTAAELLDEISRFVPAEIICNEAFYMSGMDLDGLKEQAWHQPSILWSPGILTMPFAEKNCWNIFMCQRFGGLGLEDYDCGIISAGALLQYLLETQKNSLSNLTHITPYVTGKYMLLDSSTRRNLELCETLREKQKRGSLLWVLDKTKDGYGRPDAAKICGAAADR